jgi:Ca2+-dependent lipid-binding protein
MMAAAALHMPSMPSDVKVMRYELPLASAGEAAGASSSLADADHTPGNLRVRVLEAEGLATRADGSACEPYVTVAVAELTRRRVRKTSAAVRGADVRFDEAFEFDATSAAAQVVIDVWDRPGSGPANLLGKAVLSLGECRAGVPHTYFKHLLEGKLVLRLLFDFDELPSEEEELAQYAAEYAAAMGR